MEKKIKQRVKELNTELQFTYKQIDGLNVSLKKLNTRAVEIAGALKELENLLLTNKKDDKKTK